VHDDTLLMQAINNVDEIDKCANLLAKRLREWYELYNPEASKQIDDHEKFIDVLLNKSKEDLQKELKVKFSMGADFSKENLKPIDELAEKIKEIYGLRNREKEYIEGMMKKSFPNIEAVAGAQIGAKLIAQAGGISRLSELPSSTVQLLGAEKALFRHMKTGAKPPKYGIIINHPWITNANKENKGKVARLIANKLSIAAKVDNFSGEFIGDKLKKEIEEKLKRV
jgi:nucleolar protein 56